MKLKHNSNIQNLKGIDEVIVPLYRDLIKKDKPKDDVFLTLFSCVTQMYQKTLELHCIEVCYEQINNVIAK